VWNEIIKHIPKIVVNDVSCFLFAQFTYHKGIFPTNQPINQQSDKPHAKALHQLSLIISQNLRKTEENDWAARNMVSIELQNTF
jgi:hypothetical protein